MYVVVKRLVVMFLVMFAFSVYLGSEKEVVVGSADELKGIELVVVKGGQSIKPKPIIWKQRWSQDEVYSCRHIDASFSYGSHWSNSGAIQEVFARKRILR